MRFPHRPCLLVLSAALGAYSSEPQWRDTPIGFGDRLRIVIEGREIPSILTEDHFAYFVVDRPDGDPVPCKVLASETMSTDGASLVFELSIGARTGVDSLGSAESLPLDDIPADQSHDVVLPEGWHLSRRIGDTFVFRMVDGLMVADDEVELRLSMSSERNATYLPVTPSPSDPLPRAQAPASWPAQR